MFTVFNVLFFDVGLFLLIDFDCFLFYFEIDSVQSTIEYHSAVNYHSAANYHCAANYHIDERETE
jgi:hypothetical protein